AIGTFIAIASALSCVVSLVAFQIWIDALAQRNVWRSIVGVLRLSAATDAGWRFAQHANLVAVSFSGTFRVGIVVIRRADGSAWRAALYGAAKHDPERAGKIRIAVLIYREALIFRHID